MLTPCGTGCEDAWLATASLIPLTRRVKFLVAFRPALLSPTLAAQMASTYQRLSGGRLLVNIVTGAEPAELARFGVWDDKETRYERTGEFLEVMRGAWGGEPFDFTGDALPRRAAATTRAPPDPVPRIYFGGASDAAERIAAAPRRRLPRVGRTARRWSPSASSACARSPPSRRPHARVRHPLPRDHPPDRRRGVGRRRRAARAHGSRGDRRRAGRLRDHAVGRPAAHGRAARRRSRTTCVVYPNVWAGIGLVRGGVGTALVGSLRRGRRPHRRVPRARLRRVHPVRAIRTSKRRTGSARA